MLFPFSYLQAFRGTFGTYSIIREIQRTEDKGAASNVGRVGRTCQQGHGDPWRRHPQFRRAWRLFPIFTRCWSVTYTNSRIFPRTFLGELLIFAIKSCELAQKDYFSKSFGTVQKKITFCTRHIVLQYEYVNSDSNGNKSKTVCFRPCLLLAICWNAPDANVQNEINIFTSFKCQNFSTRMQIHSFTLEVSREFI